MTKLDDLITLAVAEEERRVEEYREQEHARQEEEKLHAIKRFTAFLTSAVYEAIGEVTTGEWTGYHSRIPLHFRVNGHAITATYANDCYWLEAGAHTSAQFEALGDNNEFTHRFLLALGHLLKQVEQYAEAAVPIDHVDSKE